MDAPALDLRASPRPEGVAVIGRPLAEAEWAMVRAFVRRMAPEDLRLRFGIPLDFRDEATLRRAFDVRRDGGEMTWLQDERGAIAGIAQRVMLSRASAEIGLIVRSDVKRTGIGEFLLRHLLARSARQGLRALIAVVFRDNRAMLGLAAKLGPARRVEYADIVELTFAIGHRRPNT